jgi:predicted Zn-dependent protease
MMFNKIVTALKARKDITAWTARHITTKEIQVYAIARQTESQRTVDSESYKIDVLCATTAPDGSPAVGSGNITLLPGDDIDAGIDKAALVASLVSNPVHSIPKPAPLPDVSLVDEELKEDTVSVMRGLMDTLQATASKKQNVYLTAAECFGDIHTTHLVNSHGIDAEQESTSVAMELVLQAKKEERETESFIEKSRRRVSDLAPENEIQRHATYTLDLLNAKAPPTRQGAVVLRGETLALFVAGTSLPPRVLQTRGSAESKFAKISSWDIGKSVFTGEVKGDPLTVWANRCIPYGTVSNRFDEEGVPAQRVELIRENELVTFTASQRYAEYLDIPVTGAFGGVEIPAGRTNTSDLLAEPYIEIVQFSWFNPSPITGDFATEIRLGYLVENGARTPFHGGQLIGNFMEALADVRWSAETGFFGNYLGPLAARFNHLTVSGDEG